MLPSPPQKKAGPEFPRATYRLQLHREFGFDAAAKIAPYLARLGISHVYTSPIMTARPGSAHGYDLVDHERINPELGGVDAFLRFSAALKANALGLLVDIVPNHMSIGGDGNHWWLSVLEWGRASPHAPAFDIDWRRPGADGKVIVPILGEPYGEALEQGKLRLGFDPGWGSFSVHYGDHILPLAPASYGAILDLTRLPGGRADAALMREAVAEAAQGAIPAGEALKRQLADAARHGRMRDAIASTLKILNGAIGEPASFDALDNLIARQHWRAAYWPVAASDINYRRFFDINLLAGIRVEDPKVFDAVHRTILRLVRQGHIQGLRVDHIDGLADPAGYLRRLRRAAGGGIFIVVEKILEPGERLRSWPIAGTTGYDKLNLIDGVLLDRRARDDCLRMYAKARGSDPDFHAELAEAKRLIVARSFAGELESLISDLAVIAKADRRRRDFTRHAMRIALLEIIVACPVYRGYLSDVGIETDDRDLLDGCVRSAIATSELADTRVHDFVLATLLDGQGRTDLDPKLRRLARRFRQRIQQLTGPVMAKSLEDTLFYRYVPLLALNEVGGDPSRFGISLSDFHASVAEQAARWPATMIATATHDTKRGEDARARLLALGDDPAAWRDAVSRFERIAHRLTQGETAPPGAPDGVDRLLLLQSLLASWPQQLLGDASDAGQTLDFRRRAQEFLAKALREAKRHSSWTKPSPTYEGAVASLLDKLLDPGGEFLRALRPFARRLAFLGMLTSLTRTVVKFSLPGVPDLFQGTELWDFSFVDPDNRRPVDYAEREALIGRAQPVNELLDDWTSGAIKLRLTQIMLADRSAHPAFYRDAGYTPLAVTGSFRLHAIAFARASGDARLVTIGLRLPGQIVTGEKPPVGTAWKDTAIGLPAGRWHDILTDRDIEATGKSTGLDRILATLPVAVLRQVPS